MKIGTNEVQATLSGEGLDLVNDLLSKVAPNAKKLIEKEFEQIYQNAYNNWPVRKIEKPKTETGIIRQVARQMVKDRRDWSFKQALAVAYDLKSRNRLIVGEIERDKSKMSKEKLYVGIKLNDKSEIEFVVGNTAPYAWAIKIGADSDSSLPLGARVSNEYLWKPAKKQADKIADAIGNDLKKLL